MFTISYIALFTATLVSSAPFASTSLPHHIGSLPYAPGEVPYPDSYASHIPIRTWNTTDGRRGEAGLFYWYFPAERPTSPTPPLVIWLQGGPGSSSMIALFNELGPIKVGEDGLLRRRENAWTDHYDVLFIDQPVGTGFSYVTPGSESKMNITLGRNHAPGKGSAMEGSRLSRRQLEAPQMRQRILRADGGVAPEESRRRTRAPYQEGVHDEDYMDGYVTTQTGCSKDLLTFMFKFYDLYPQLRNRDLYLAGESYAGKYIPSFASAILNYNEKAKEPIPLKGVAIGNGLTDPITQIQHHTGMALALGLVNDAQAARMTHYANNAVALIQQGRYVEAVDERFKMFDVFANATGDMNYYDIRKSNRPNDWSLMNTFLARPDVVMALNAGSRGYGFGRDERVAKALRGDIMQSVAGVFPRLFSKLKVLLYQGQFDIRDGVEGNIAWLKKVTWSGQEEYLNAKRQVWRMDKDVVGYVTKAKSLTHVVILNGGHLTPMDQGEVCQHMLENWIEEPSVF